MNLPSLTTPTHEAPNPFDAFDSLGVICAFIHKKLGADAVRQALEQADSLHPLTREFVEDGVAELKAVSLHKVAAILAGRASTLPSELDLCPYDPDSINGRSWIASHQRRQASVRRSRRPFHV